MEFMASSGSKGFIGLGNTMSIPPTLQEIKFGIAFGGGSWTIREAGFVYRTDGTYSYSAVFRIGVEGGQVVYRKNGIVIYTSTAAPSYPLVVGTNLYAAGDNIYNATVSFNQATPTPTPTPTPAPPNPPDPTPAEIAAALLSPKNATGGTNLYSQNFGWGTSLVNLPGRAGLDANLGISYNSLVWINIQGQMYFDPDESNVTPGFRMGFPVIKASYLDEGSTLIFYIMVTPSGQRVAFRPTAVSGTYETTDSSYAQLVVGSGANPPLTVTSTDGTMLSYQWVQYGYRCVQVKDRNGNLITNAYDANNGRLLTMADTLGRVVTINYYGDGTTATIQQTWKDTNGAGTNTTHTWATLSYTDAPVSINFGSIPVHGPRNGTMRVLDQIKYADLSYTKFTYNGYVQVQKIENYAADNHLLNYVSTDLDSVPTNP